MNILSSSLAHTSTGKLCAGGDIQDAYWYENAGWKTFQLVSSGVAAKGGLAATTRTSQSLEIFYGQWHLISFLNPHQAAYCASLEVAR